MESYPNDEALLALAEDAETGVAYIETGRTPYYREFRRLVYRLLDTARRAGDLRVYRAGGLSIGVKAGAFWDGATVRVYPGCEQAVLADNQAAIFVYLDADGQLVTDETGGFPDADRLHIRLAQVQTGGGAIVALTDCRGQHLWNGPVSGAQCVPCGASGGLAIVFHARLEGGATVAIHAGDAPFAYRLIDGWSVARGTAGGSWQVFAGGDPVSEVVTLGTQSGVLNRVAGLDPVVAEVGKGGALSVAGDGANANCDVWLMAVRMVQDDYDYRLNNGQPWSWQAWFALYPAGITEVAPGAVYGIHDDVTLGDGSTATAFLSRNEMVWFDEGKVFHLREQAAFQVGELHGDWGVNGSVWSLGPVASWQLMTNLTTPVFNLYASRLHIRSNNRCQFYGGHIDIRNTTLSAVCYEGGPNTKSGFYLYGPCQTIALRKVQVLNAAALSFNRTPDVCDRVHCHRCYNGLSSNGADIVAEGVEMTGCEKDLVQSGGVSSLRLDNPAAPVGLVQLSENDANAWIGEYYDCRIETVDEAGQAVVGANVTLRRSSLASQDGQVYRCVAGHVSDAFYAELAAGYWVADDGFAAAPAWRSGAVYQGDQTDTAIYNGSEGLLTDADGVALWNGLTPRAPHRRWTTTDELESRWVYRLTVQKANYELVEIDRIELDRLRHWRLVLPARRPVALAVGPVVGAPVAGAF